MDRWWKERYEKKGEMDRWMEMMERKMREEEEENKSTNKNSTCTAISGIYSNNS